MTARPTASGIRCEDVDVLVVGAGPAGSTTAGLLAGQGIDTLVLDRTTFPRPKPCGECISPGGVRALDRLGLLPEVLGCHPARIEDWTMHTAGGAVARAAYPAHAGSGLGLSRAVLDSTLVRAARARGAQVEEGQRVTAVTVEAGRAPKVRVTATGANGERREWRARIVIGADGLRSVVARRLHMLGRPRLRKVSLTCRVRGAGPPPQGGRLFFTARGTVGLAPVHAEEPLWNVTTVFYADRWGRVVGRDPLRAFYTALRAAPFRWDDGEPEVVEGPWASGPFDWPSRRAVADGVVLVGDAAGYYDPLTGQGIARALRSAELAAPVAARAVRTGRAAAGDLIAYQHRLRRALRPTRLVQRAVEALLGRWHTRELAIGTLARSRPLAERLVGVVGDVVPVRALLDPRVLWPVVAG